MNITDKLHTDTSHLRYEGTIYIDGRSIPNAIIDTCQLSENKYETMILKHGKDYRTIYSTNLKHAEEAFNYFVKAYTTPPEKPVIPPLSSKYKKLSDDLKKAMEYAKHFDEGEDGGTCNFDSPAIRLPHWIESKVKQAAEEAGSSAFKWDLYGNPRYVFAPPTKAQGNRRCRVTEAMCQALSNMGYDVLEYSQMD